ncbi:MAG: outer membrane beta-barrel protein, partial [Bacteroidaceae bacterium]|nr:outer membrane beta-barrel protein [Bacteroidaceae bacterium]
ESNPLSRRLGNPDLKNASRHLITVNYSHQVPRREQTLSLRSSYDVTLRQIMQTYDYDSQSGAYTYRPKNVNGNWWWDGGVNFTSALDSARHWRLTNDVRIFRHNVAYVANGEETTTRRVNLRERFSLRYKLNERFDVETTAQAEWERAWSPLATYRTTNIWDISYGVNLHWRLPWELHLSTDLREYHRRGFEDSSLNTNHLIWNAQLSRSFLKGQLTAKLAGYDLLSQISHTSWHVGSDGISSTWQRGIPSYVMAHIGWNFSRKPKK